MAATPTLQFPGRTGNLKKRTSVVFERMALSYENPAGELMA
jgi:hypothetical protein